MPWETTLVNRLRIFIMDIDTPQTYTDDRLADIIAAAASFVVVDVDFDTNYVIDTDTPDITPDPVDGTEDKLFTNLVLLKAACIIDQGNARLAALASGIEAKCGPAVLNTMQRMSGFKELLTLGACAAYAKFKEQYLLGNADFCKAILSPFVNSEFCPEDLLLYSHRQFNHNEYRV